MGLSTLQNLMECKINKVLQSAYQYSQIPNESAHIHIYFGYIFQMAKHIKALPDSRSPLIKCWFHNRSVSWKKITIQVT